MKVTIRPLVEKDAYTSVEWRNIPDIWTYTTFSNDKVITIEDELCWIKNVLVDESSERFAILADGVYVGNTYLTDIKNGVGQFHIFIGDKNYWGKGIAMKASILIIEFAKNHLGLNEIELSVKKENTAAFKIYKKIGFQEMSQNGYFTRMKLILSESTLGKV